MGFPCGAGQHGGGALRHPGAGPLAGSAWRVFTSSFQGLGLIWQDPWTGISVEGLGEPVFLVVSGWRNSWGRHGQVVDV